MPKKTKKTVKAARQKKRSSKKKKPSLFKRLFKAFIVAGLWCAIIGVIVIAWFAAELPEITSDIKFERKRAITFLAADGSQIAQVGELKGETVNVSALPSHVVHALLSIEDRRFYSHFGIDPLGIARAMVVNVTKGRFVQGGSTITQQLAKNLFLTQDRTLKRKLQEALLALWLESKFTKDEILTAYFNRVYFGSGTYGIEAASEKYFQKHAKNLNVYEGAMLVGLLKAPSRFSPLNNPDLAKARTQTVLSAMKDAGYHYKSDGQTVTKLVTARVSDARQERYFTDWLMDKVSLHIGAVEEDLIVQTTLSSGLQEQSERALLSKLDALTDVKVTQGAVVVLSNDGAVRAMVGGRNYGDSQFNRATQALRPPGSSFKPFVYLTALNRGIGSRDIILDAPITSGKYRPKNFGDLYYGDVTMKQALALSLNTVAIRLTEQLGGIGYVIGTARKLGITSKLERDMSLSLGSSGVSLIEMTSAFTVFPNGGVRPEPFAILNIRDREGNTYYTHKSPRGLPQLFPRRIINNMNDMLQNVVENGTAKVANPGFPAGGKTGTSQDFRDAWFIGFTSDYTAGVWLGNDDNSKTERMTGGKAPAEIWRNIMRGSGGRKIERSHIGNEPQTRGNDNGGGSGFGSFISRILSSDNTIKGDNSPPRYNE